MIVSCHQRMIMELIWIMEVPLNPGSLATDVLRKYIEEDTKFTAVGGETCDDTFSPQNDCEPAGHAETEMKNMHYSFLNAAYNTDVDNDWDSSGCMNSIKKNLVTVLY